MDKKTYLLISIFVFLTICGFTAWWFFVRESISQPAIEIPDWYYTDKDGDGILDVRERELGTNPEETDTDGDTIPDRLEIENYGTDPTNPDTDKDGYPDGIELLQGFNPLERTTNN